MDIKELYKKAGDLHGHYCPGLAVGVRAAAEALNILNVERGIRGLYCIAEQRACYLDGIQSVFGTTMGNKNIELRETGDTAFDFYDRAGGQSVRLFVKPQPEGLTREEKTDFILTAAFDDVFERTPVRFAAPEYTPKK